MVTENKSIMDIEQRSELVFYEAETQDFWTLSPEEQNLYRYYLVRNAYKKNTKGEYIKPVHANIADLVLSEARMIVLNQDLYIYNDDTGTYCRDREGRELRTRIKNYLDREFADDKTLTAITNLIMNDPRITVPVSRINNRPKHWIHFKNGYYDFKTDTLRDHNPDYYEIGVIPWDYSPSRYPTNYKFVKRGEGILRETCEEALIFDRWIEEAIPDYSDRVMLYQFIGYAMTLDTSEQKFIMVVGPGGTGKSTLLKLIEEILGRENVSSISLQGLQDRFAPAGLFLKQANMCADIPLSALSEVDMIKKLTGEDTISADRKFKDPFTFRSYARLFFSANSIPYIDEKTNAFYRRMLILKMESTPKEVDPGLFEKLREEIPNIITRCSEEFYCSAGAVDISDNSREAVKSAHLESDSVEAFIVDRCETDPDARTERHSLYDAYKNYCFNEGRRELTPTGFYKALANKGYKQAKGKTRDFLGLKLSKVVSFGNYSSADFKTDRQIYGR